MTVENTQPSTETSNKPTTTSMHNKHFRMLLLQQYVEQENSSATSSCMLQSLVANQTTYFDDFNEPTSDGKCFDSSDISMLQELVYNSTPCLQGIAHPQPRWTETSQQQQQFQKWIQDISAYEMIHPVIDDALKVSTAINNLRGPIQQHLLLQVRPHHTWQEVRQMIDNFFANSYMHLPGQTIGNNIDQDINIVRKKGKGKYNNNKGKRKREERKRKRLQQQQQLLHNYNYNHYNTYHNQSQQPQKGKSKGKGPIGSFDNNNTGKGKHIKGDKNNNKGKGKSTSSTSTSKCWVCGKLGHRAASCWYNTQKNINNVQQQQLPPQHQQFQLQGTSDQPIAHMPPEGITTFNFQQVPQQQQPQLQYQQVRQALPSTSASSVTRVSTPGPHIYDISSTNNMYGCGGGQPPGIGGHRHYFDINQLKREHLRDLPRGSLRRWAIYGYKDTLVVCNNISLPASVLQTRRQSPVVGTSRHL